jgi:hypothetical protein
MDILSPLGVRVALLLYVTINRIRKVVVRVVAVVKMVKVR